MSSSSYRLYCAVYGCLNSTPRNPNMTFFKLPANPQRRLEWLYLICRDDLANKPKFSSYRICEAHFKPNEILQSSQRKLLKRNALPSLRLPAADQKGLWGEDKGTQAELPNVTENCTQTDIVAIESCAGTSDTTMKRKLEFEFPPVKKSKGVESTFQQLCDDFLTKNLALLIKTQSNAKKHGRGHRYETDYLAFCINLYHVSPQAYQFLQSSLCLPRAYTLYKYCFPITTEINERGMNILKMKVAKMTEAEKNCSVMIDAMPLQLGLFYNIKKDEIKGFQEIEGCLSPEIARKALVIMVRGIFANWKQPIAYVLLSEFVSQDEINNWIIKVLQKLLEIGLNIRFFVSDHGPDLWIFSKKRLVSVDKPYFFIDNKKIYYVFDAPDLIKSVRDTLMQFDIQFGNSVAKYNHIKQFYKNDVKESDRLAPKLTPSHITPKNVEKTKTCLATQLLSRSVANGISMNIDKKNIGESGKDTAKFCIKMNNLFDSLNSSKLKDSNGFKKAYEGNRFQKSFFDKMISFLQELKLINQKNGRNCTSGFTLFEAFQITIKSLMLLFDDLHLEGHNFLMTRRCNLDTLRSFCGQLRTKSRDINPTSRQFVWKFKKLYLCNIMKPLKRGNCGEDFGKLFVETTSEEVDEAISIDDEEFYNIQITGSYYKKLSLPEQGLVFYISGYLLKNCLEKHNGCQTLKSYVKPHQGTQEFSAESIYSWYQDKSKNLDISLIIPCDDFVKYVEKMEKIFKASFRTKSVHSKVAACVYKELKDIPFSFPCPCFPKVFLIKLFIQTRIFLTLRRNNKAFRMLNSTHKYFTVSIP